MTSNWRTSRLLRQGTRIRPSPSSWLWRRRSTVTRQPVRSSVYRHVAEDSIKVTDLKRECGAVTTLRPPVEARVTPDWRELVIGDGMPGRRFFRAARPRIAIIVRIAL